MNNQRRMQSTISKKVISFVPHMKIIGILVIVLILCCPAQLIADPQSGAVAPDKIVPQEKAEMPRRPHVDAANIEFRKGLESDPSVEDFIKLFRQSSFPINIPTKLSEKTIAHDDKLPPQYLIKFFQIKRPDNVRYYPKYLVFRNSIFFAVICKVNMPGVDLVQYFLSTFTATGQLISNLDIGRFGGDITGQLRSNTVINEKLVINIQEIETSSNEAEDGRAETRKVYRDETHAIMSNGMIQQVVTKESKLIK